VRAFRLDIPPPVATVIRHLSPETKQRLKAALRSLATDPGSGEPLLRELEGFLKYRVRRFRIVYAVDHKERVIRVVAVGHRRRIYEDLIDRLRQERGG
jgi:mRNA interferase RelE/StbE